MQQIEPYAHPGLPTVPQPQPLPLTYYSSLETEDEISLKQILGVLYRRAWLVAGVAIAVTGTIWGWTFTRTPIYQASFQVLVEPSAMYSSKSQQLLPEAQLSQIDFDYATQIEVFRSPELLMPVLQVLQKSDPDLTYDLLVERLAITRLKNTKILVVSYRDPNPEKVQTVLQQLSEHYLGYSVEQRQQNLQQGVQFVAGQLPELEKRVTSLQLRLERFRQQHSLIDPESRGAELAGLIGAIEKQRQETQTQLAEAQSLYTVLERQVGYNPGDAIAAAALSESSRYQKLLNQIQEVETQIAAESARFQADSPNIQALVDKRDTLVPLLQQESQRILGTDRPALATGNLTSISLDLSKQLVNTANQVQVLQVRAQALFQAERQMKQEFALVPALARQYTDLQRELKIATDSLNRFLATRETLEIEAAQKAVPWQLIAASRQPSYPISPNIPLNLTLGVVAGLLLGMGAALLAENLDNVFHSANDLKDITKLPLLGIIPYRQALPKLHLELGTVTVDRAGASPFLPDSGTLAQPELSGVFHPTPAGETSQPTPFLDAFRSLYTNIRLLSSDTPIQSLVISSAVPSDGKSTAASYLAQAAAAMGQRVLLVDADLRRPQVHTKFGLSNMRGLSNVISTNLNPREVIQQSSTEPNLWILTAGQIPPDPTKLLSSKKMKVLMQRFQSAFDFVIYDTPPLLGLADSSLLATETDGVILIVGLGSTDRSALLQALEGLKISSTSVLGIVANRVKTYASGDYYQAYYNRYYTQKKP